MDKFKTLKTIVWMCIAILVLQMTILLIIIRPDSFLLWVGFAVVAIMCLYMGRISLGLISELKDKTREVESLKNKIKNNVTNL